MKRIIFFVVFLLISNVTSAKASCEWEYKELRKIQKAMNRGYREYSAEYVREMERRAKSRYQDCRKNKNKSKSKSNTKNSNFKSYKPSQRQIEKEAIRKYRNSTRNKPKPFQNSSIVTKSRYKDQVKQRAWIEYYQRPKECQRTKTLAEFSKCVEFENVKAKEFDIMWDKSKAPKSFKLGKH